MIERAMTAATSTTQLAAPPESDSVPANPAQASHPPESGSNPEKESSKPENTAPKPPPAWKIYTLPAPIRTHPLPSFYPNNPISLVHLAYAWLSQVLLPPKAEPSVVHRATWSAKTRSVHVTDAQSIRALWEQGFYGKGSYSRSEPNWLKREETRRGDSKNHVAESFTVQRRNVRRQMKWDRARKEQEAILRVRLAEAWVAPVGPRELLALPNSHKDLEDLVSGPLAASNLPEEPLDADEPDESLEEGKGLNGHAKETAPTHLAHGTSSTKLRSNGHVDRPQTPIAKPPPDSANDSTEEPGASLRRRKSVRFSPKVESTTFQYSDPPSPNHAMVPNGNGNGKVPDGILTNGHSALSREPSLLSIDAATPVEATPAEVVASPPKAEPTRDDALVDIEHLQLTLEETFFLTFGLGALVVEDEQTGAELNVERMFHLFRQYSYFPPRSLDLQPDDPFLVHYAVYHHFRSLGWVTRPGIKFGCDWLLYNRGPVFSHAEFAIVVLPAYSDPYWRAHGRQAPKKSWHWLHAVNRVQSVAFKTLVLVYVDIPPPAGDALDIASTLKRYSVREFQIRRWLSNRNRDVK